MGDFEYKAFISYSHRDAKWARWLLTALETYRLPADSPAQTGLQSKRGIGKVFRDRDEAGAAGDLKEEIERALVASEHLIVVTSPNSARSRYVEAEIEAFASANLKRSAPGRILTLIVDGEPNVSSEGEDPRECFPPALRGGLTRPDGTRFEPLAADARSVGDGKTRALAKLVSGLLDIRYDTLVRRDLQRRRRAQWLAGLAGLASVIVAGIVAVVIVLGDLQRDAAERDARTARAFGDAAAAQRLLDSGNKAGAIELARRALPSDGSVPYIPAAQAVLYGALFAPSVSTTLDIAKFGIHTPLTIALGDGAHLTGGDMGSATIWSPAEGVTFRRTDIEGQGSASPDNSVVLFVAAHGRLIRFTSATREWDELDTSAMGAVMKLAMLDGKRFYGCYLDKFLVADIEESGAAVLKQVAELPSSCWDVQITEAGTALVGTQNAVVEYDSAGQLVRTFETGEFRSIWVRSTGRHVIASGNNGTKVFARTGGSPILEFGGGFAGRESVSRDGRYVVEVVATDPPKNVIHDLETMTSTPLDCTACWFIGHLDDGRLLVQAEKSIDAYDVTTGRSLGSVHTDPTIAMSLLAVRSTYFAADDVLILYPFGQPARIIQLLPNQNSTELMNGADREGDELRFAAFTGGGLVTARESFVEETGLEFGL